MGFKSTFDLWHFLTRVKRRFDPPILINTDPSGHLFGIDNLIGSAVGAVIGGVTAAITGGDIWQGIATGAVMGFFTSGASAFMDSSWAMATAGDLVNAGVFGVAGAAAGATNAAIWGQDIGQGALYGGIFGAAASFGTPNFTPFGDSAAGSMANRFVNSSLTGAGFGAAYAGMTGGDIGQGAARGALGWAAGEGANMLIGHGLGYAMSGKRPDHSNGAFYMMQAASRHLPLGG